MSSRALDLRERNPQTERMDDPGLDAGRFVGSLRGLRRVNRATGSARILWPGLEEPARLCSDGPLRVLDVACGGGDVAIALWRRLRARNLPVVMHGCDVNPVAVEYANRQAGWAAADVSFFQLDAVRDALPEGYDVIMSSLFLHHLTDAEAAAFLRGAARAARHRVLIHDLVRSRVGYLLAHAGVRLLLCNEVCHADGPLSVQRAFTVAEAQALCREAGLESATVETRFPFRLLLRWTRP